MRSGIVEKKKKKREGKVRIMEYEREIKKKKGLNAITGESREGCDWFETSNKEKKKKNTDLSKKKKKEL